MADVGNPFGWGLKPEFPVLNWNHPLAAQLILDVNHSFLGGTEFELTTGALGATAGTVVGNGQNGPVHVYSGSTGVDTYTSRGLVADARHISFEVVAFVAGAGGGGGFPRAFDGNLNFLLNEGSGLFNFQQNGWSGGASNIDGPAYPVGSWFQVIFTYDNTTLSTVPTYYINGVLQTPGTVITAPAGTPPTDSLATPTTIGNRAAADRGWNGQISHVRIWNRVLSVDEVAQLFADPWVMYDRMNLNAAALKAAGGTTYNVSMTEAGGAADAASSQAVLVANDNEAGSASDTVTSTAIFPRTVTEAGTAVDSPSSLAVLPAAITESASPADTVSNGSTYGGTITEAGSAADAVSSIATLPAAITESLAAVDLLASLAALKGNITEAGTAADTQGSAATLPATLSDSLSALDAPSVRLVLVSVIAEAGAAADSPSSAAVYPSAITETSPISDTEDSVQPGTVTISESATAQDTVSAKLVAASAVAEAGSAQSNQSSQGVIAGTITEGAVASDLVSGLAVLAAIIAETSPITDFPSTPAGPSSNISEFMSAQDLVSCLVFPLPFPDACRIAGQLAPVRLVDGPSDIVRTIDRTDIVRVVLGECC